MIVGHGGGSRPRSPGISGTQNGGIHGYKLYEYGSTPKIAGHKVQYLHFGYLKLLVAKYNYQSVWRWVSFSLSGGLCDRSHEG